MKFEMFRGDTPSFEIACTLDDGTDTPIDLAGAQLRFTAKLRLSDPDSAAVIAKSESDGISIVGDGSSGMAVLALASGDTAALDVWTKLFFDVQLVEADQNVATLATGVLIVQPDVTRTTP